ncbi:MAG: helix-turn-helix transcriptional regulator [Polyangiaceae bacterium]|nr:helix-turn-helix transcriptional regulator [Polyangiaceae bacterium]
MSDWQARLAEAMEARGLSGGELARRSGFTSQYINSLRNKDRGARLPHDTARKLAASLGVAVEWLVSGNGPRERLSDVYPVYQGGDAPASGYTDRYPSRIEAIALLASTAPPEVIQALLAVVPDDPSQDPGRGFWIDYAKQLASDLRRIKNDPAFSGENAALPKKRSRA